MDSEVTRLLGDWRDGNARARDRLIELLYPELRRLAAQLFRGERANHTLQPTALVNEAWLRLAGTPAERVGVEHRSHLFGVAARLMRQILIDHARARAAQKRDGGERVTLSGILDSGTVPPVDLLDLDRALAELERVDAGKARIIELRYFGGLGIEEVAEATGLSPAIVKRHWQAARLWLFHALGEGGEGEPPQ